MKDRILELIRVRAGDLYRHPQNWRVHPARQRAAMSRVLHEIGYADALIARRLPDGALELIDGHLRAGKKKGDILLCHGGPSGTLHVDKLPNWRPAVKKK